MIWGKTDIQREAAKKKFGDEEIKFAYLPVQLKDGRWVWWEHVRCVRDYLIMNTNRYLWSWREVVYRICAGENVAKNFCAEAKMDTVKCPSCGMNTMKEKIISEFHTKLENVPFVVNNAKILECEKCGERIFSAKEIKRWEKVFLFNFPTSELQKKLLKEKS